MGTSNNPPLYQIAPWPRWLGEIASEDPADARPFLVPGVRVRFNKITRSMKRRAQHEAAGLLPDVEGSADRDPLDMADAGDAYSLLLIRQGICEWEGLGDADGKPLAVSPDAIELFLGEEALFDAADVAYVIPEVLRDAEKNGLSASPSGIGAAATQASDTVTSSAAIPKTGGANPTRKPGKRAARTSKTSLGQTTEPISGT
jgi:hypothetical protein